LPVDLLFHYHQYPHDLAPISAELCYFNYGKGKGKVVPVLN
jgi:hypothetical protein